MSVIEIVSQLGTRRLAQWLVLGTERGISWERVTDEVARGV